MAAWKEYASWISPGSTLSTCTLHCGAELLLAAEDFSDAVWPASSRGDATATATITARHDR